MEDKIWNIWESNKYIGMITYDSYYKNFEFIARGYIHPITFLNSIELENGIEKYFCTEIKIPDNIKDEIDSIALFNIL